MKTAQNRIKKIPLNQERLDAKVLDIEFLLISVIQGVALAALAADASSVIGNFQFEYVLYVVSGFLLILNFWSQAIIHTLSFIDWPLDLTHNFLYFLVSFVEVMAFSQMTNPLKWFAFMLLFFLVAAVLYVFDLSLIKKHKQKLSKTPQDKAVFAHIMNRELFELKTLLPAGIAFNLFAVLLIYLYPSIFLAKHYHMVLIAIQALFALFVLRGSINNFKTRSQLLEKRIGS